MLSGRLLHFQIADHGSINVTPQPTKSPLLRVAITCRCKRERLPRPWHPRTRLVSPRFPIPRYLAIQRGARTIELPDMILKASLEKYVHAHD